MQERKLSMSWPIKFKSRPAKQSAETPELMPCPFCGEQLVFPPFSFEGARAWHPTNDCCLVGFSIPKEERARWNRRA